MKKILTIAGSDCSGGAGIQADLKTFSSNFTYGMSVITALTAQNTQGVDKILNLNKDFIESQLDSIFSDIEVDAVKVGMVSQIEIIESISKKLKEYNAKNIVIDPVMVSKSGFHLLEPLAKTALIRELIPLATLVTPNIPEAKEILKTMGVEIETIESLEEMKSVAKIIYSLGCKNVLVKGGHREGEAVDVLYTGEQFYIFESKRLNNKHTHGTGCSLSACIASYLGRGYSIEVAVEEGKKFVTLGIENSFPVGKGIGPINHFYSLYKKSGFLNK